MALFLHGNTTWHGKMSNTFCLTVPHCVPSIYSVGLELSSSEKRQAPTVADSGMGWHPWSRILGPEAAVWG